MADHNRKLPTCESCGAADTYRIDLDTRPAVYGCDACMSLFTHKKRAPDPATTRALRRCLIQRWDQLADDVWHLMRDIRGAPDGTFTDQERNDAVLELDNTVWNVFVNHRPRLPGSAYARAKNHRLLRERAAYLDAIAEEYREAGEAKLAEGEPDASAEGG